MGLINYITALVALFLSQSFFSGRQPEKSLSAEDFICKEWILFSISENDSESIVSKDYADTLTFFCENNTYIFREYHSRAVRGIWLLNDKKDGLCLLPREGVTFTNKLQDDISLCDFRTKIVKISDTILVLRLSGRASWIDKSYKPTKKGK